MRPCIGRTRRDGARAPCAFDDDFTEIGSAVIDADAVVYATPLYYHAPSPQLLAAVSRLHDIALDRLSVKEYEDPFDRGPKRK